MLVRCTKVLSWTLELRDGHTGRIEDCYLDDRRWALRYFSASGFEGLAGRKVLVTPGDVDRPEPQRHTLVVHISEDQARQTRSIAAEVPVSGAPAGDQVGRSDRHMHWGVVPVPAIGSLPLEVAPEDTDQGEPPSDTEQGRPAHPSESMPDLPRLRGLQELRGTRIRGVQGHSAVLDDLLLDTDPWETSHLLIVSEGGERKGELLLAPIRALAGWDRKELRLRLRLSALPAIDTYALGTMSREQLDREIRQYVDDHREG